MRFQSKIHAFCELERRHSGRGERAFTLVEIALALAIIAFALVAIIGVLPAGLNVQRENREDTIINQDGLYFLESIRRGARDLDDLTNYVDAITRDLQYYRWDGSPEVSLKQYFTANASNVRGFELTNGYRIVALLSTPKYIPDAGGYWSNSITAYVRSVSGLAAEKADNPQARDFAFAYRLTSEIVPYGFHFTNTAQMLPTPNAVPLPPTLPEQLTNARVAQLNVDTNLTEIRLTLEWPLRPPVDGRFNRPTNTGRGSMTFRTMAGGGVNRTGSLRPVDLYFINPQTYVKAQ